MTGVVGVVVGGLVRLRRTTAGRPVSTAVTRDGTSPRTGSHHPRVEGLAGGRVCALSGTENRGHSELGSVVVAARNANVYRVFSGLAFGSGAAVGVRKRLFLAGFVRVLNGRFGLDHGNGPEFIGVFEGV